MLKAEPEGDEHIMITIGEPSCMVDVKATVPLKAAIEFGERLISLARVLKGVLK